MKRKLSILIILTLLITFFSGVTMSNAQQTPNYNWQPNNPITFYIRADDETGYDHIDIDLTNMDAGQEVDFDIEVVNLNNQTIEIIDTVTVDEADLTYGDGNLSFDLYPYYDSLDEDEKEDVTFIRVRDLTHNYIIEQCAFTKEPSQDFRSSGDFRSSFYAVGFGDVVYNEFGDGLLHDEESFGFGQTLFNDGIIAMHFRSGNVGYDNEYMIKLANENDNSIFAEFSLTELIDWNRGNQGDRFKNTFVPITNDDRILDLLPNINIRFDTYDNPFELDFTNGVYTYGTFDDTDSNEAYGESTFIVSDSNDYEFKVERLRDSVAEGNRMTWRIRRYTSEINDVYNSHNVYDLTMPSVYYDDLLESFDDLTEVSYIVEDPATANGRLMWLMDKSDDWYFGRPASDYGFESSSTLYGEYSLTYDIKETPTVEDRLDNFLDTFGMSDEVGKLFIVAVSMVATSIGLAVYGIMGSAILLINLILIAMFGLIGFIPAWVIIAVLIISLGVLFTGRSE